MSSRIVRVFVVLALLAGVLAACSSGEGGSLLDSIAATTTGAGPGTTGTMVTAATTTTTEPPSAGAVEVVLPSPDTLIRSEEFGTAPADLIGVTLEAGQTPADAERIAAALGGTVVGRIELLDFYQIQTAGTTEADLRALLDTARSQSGVEFAIAESALSGKDLACRSSTVMNETSYTEGDNARPYEMIGLEDAWDILRASGASLGNVHVGVMDSKLNNFSTEIGGDPKISGVSDADTTDDPARDKDGNIESGGLTHGTQVAHTIAADADNGGVAGVASVLGDKIEVTVDDIFTGPSFSNPSGQADDPTQVILADGNPYTMNTLAGIIKQIEDGATVINMSYGPEFPDPKWAWHAQTYKKFFERVHEKYPGVVFVAAAGNEGDRNVGLDGNNYFPGGLDVPNLITVGALDKEGDRAWFSNFESGNGEVTLAAPGTAIPTGVGVDGTTVTSNGTSFSSPMVAGAVALLQSVNPKLTAVQIKQILVETAYAGAPAREGSDTSTLVPENVGGGMLRVDEAVIRVINDLRADADPPQDPLDKDTLLALANVAGSAAVTGANEFDVTATVAGVRAGSTSTLSVELLGEGLIAGDSSVVLDAPGSTTWPVSLLDGSNPPTVRVCRTQSDACCTMYLETISVLGTWNGGLTVTEIQAMDDIVIDFCLPGESECEPIVITKEECEQSSAATTEADPTPITMVFTGNVSGGGVTLTVSSEDGDETVGPASWRILDGDVMFRMNVADEESQGVMSFTGRAYAEENQAVLSGSWTLGGVENLLLGGDFRVTRPLEP